MILRAGSRLAADKQLKTIFENNTEVGPRGGEEGQGLLQSGWLLVDSLEDTVDRVLRLDESSPIELWASTRARSSSRNVANQVIGTDMSMMSVIQYAVNVLKVPHIVICGHYDRGGVKASMENVDHVPPLENWLRNIRDTYQAEQAGAGPQLHDKDQRDAGVWSELNTIEQAFAVSSGGGVDGGPRRRRVQTCAGGGRRSYAARRIHAVVFDPGTGELEPAQLSTGSRSSTSSDRSITCTRRRRPEARAERPATARYATGRAATPKKKKGFWERPRRAEPSVRSLAPHRAVGRCFVRRGYGGAHVRVGSTKISGGAQACWHGARASP